MSYKNAISSDDPKALEKLNEKLEICEKAQKYMKAVNAYFRKMGTCHGYPGMDDERANRLDQKIINGYSWEKAPFVSYELSGNTAEIRRLKSRIAELSVSREVGFVGWEFDGGEAVINTDINRLQLVFDEKPSEEQRTALKQNGFHWSPSEQAWQRQLNRNAIYAAGYMDFVRPESGESPISLQPKVPHKDSPER